MYVERNLKKIKLSGVSILLPITEAAQLLDKQLYLRHYTAHYNIPFNISSSPKSTK